MNCMTIMCQSAILVASVASEAFGWRAGRDRAAALPIADPSMAAPCIAARPSSPQDTAMVLPQRVSRQVSQLVLRRVLLRRPAIRHTAMPGPTATYRPTTGLPSGNRELVSVGGSGIGKSTGEIQRRH
jgi:hypothetical protein